MSTPTRILLIVVLGLVLAGGGLAAWYLVQPQPSGIVSSETSTTGSALIGGPFTLTDQTGVRRSEADLEGRYALVYRSEEHTSELQSLMRISYAVFCLKTKTQTSKNTTHANDHKRQ